LHGIWANRLPLLGKQNGSIQIFVRKTNVNRLHKMKSEEFWNSRKKFSHGLGKPFGVPVRVHYSVYLALLLFAIYGLARNVDYSKPWPDLWRELLFLFFLITIFVSILLHEIGHAGVAVILKRKVHGIIIYPFMGGTISKQSETLSAKNDILVIIAGPFTNFAVAGILSYLSNSDFVNAVAEANIWIGCLNLLPLWPLDGGRILKSVLLLKNLGYMRINRVMLASSRISALGMGVTAFRNEDYVLFIFTVLLLSVAHIEFSRSK